MKLNHSKIQEVINKLSLMKVELAILDTMFIAYRVDEALKKISHDYAELRLAEQKEVKNEQN